MVLEVSGDLHYAAVPPFVSEAEALLKPGLRRVVLDLSHAHEIRFTALRAFEALAVEVEAAGGRLWLAGANEDVQALVRRSGSPLRGSRPRRSSRASASGSASGRWTGGLETTAADARL